MPVPHSNTYYSSGQARLPKVKVHKNSGQARPPFGVSHQAIAGQALAELIIACAILAIILFGVVNTINFSINSIAVATSKTRAIYYAEQGLEQARVVRNGDWDTFVANAYVNGENNIVLAGTPFHRTILLSNDSSVPAASGRRVTSTVTWVDGATTYTTTLTTVLTKR